MEQRPIESTSSRVTRQLGFYTLFVGALATMWYAAQFLWSVAYGAVEWAALRDAIIWAGGATLGASGWATVNALIEWRRRPQP